MTNQSASTDLIAYSVSEAQIAELRNQFSGLAVRDPELYEPRRKAIATLRELRLAVEQGLNHGGSVVDGAPCLNALEVRRVRRSALLFVLSYRAIRHGLEPSVLELRCVLRKKLCHAVRGEQRVLNHLLKVQD